MPTKSAITLSPPSATTQPWPVLATLAIATPLLLAYNVPPSSTFLNQGAALLGWGGWLAVAAMSIGRAGAAWRAAPGLGALQGALLLVGVAALASPLWTGLPWSLALSGAGMVAAAMLAAQVGAALAQGGLARPAFRALCIGLVVAAVANCAIGLLQVFAPGWTDGNWIARTYIEGRAVGNMRQPNHLSSLLLWGIVAAVWLGESRALGRWGAPALIALFVGVDELSGSRTGGLSLVLLAVWGLADRRLSRTARLALVLAPLLYGALLLGSYAWAQMGHHAIGGETRIGSEGDISSSRFGIWSNTLALIRMHPWAGVGFGEFNFAWTLTPFPRRPVAFFDHTHDLPLQLLVELGIPLGSLVIVLLLAALGAALRAALRAPAVANPTAADGLLQPAAFVMVLLIVVHSLLEYPLWYAYYLLPAAFAFGLCLVPQGALRAAPARAHPLLLIGGVVLMLAAALALVDYRRVVVIFAPGDDAAPLAQRIVDGRASIFFSHHADYAAATTSDHPADVMPAFRGAPHYLLDARLLMAWAKALDEAGDSDRARYLAQRLREFRNEAAAEFFAPCEAPVAGAPAPFQCRAPQRALTFEDFRAQDR